MKIISVSNFQDTNERAYQRESIPSVRENIFSAYFQKLDNDFSLRERAGFVRLAIIMPFILAAGIYVSTLYRITRIITLVDLWHPKFVEKDSLLKERLFRLLEHGASLLFVPIIAVTMEILFIIGVFFPRTVKIYPNSTIRKVLSIPDGFFYIN